jgi:hypothetical protein
LLRSASAAALIAPAALPAIADAPGDPHPDLIQRWRHAYRDLREAEDRRAAAERAHLEQSAGYPQVECAGKAFASNAEIDRMLGGDTFAAVNRRLKAELASVKAPWWEGYYLYCQSALDAEERAEEIERPLFDAIILDTGERLGKLLLKPLRSADLRKEVDAALHLRVSI